MAATVNVKHMFVIIILLKYRDRVSADVMLHNIKVCHLIPQRKFSVHLTSFQHNIDSPPGATFSVGVALSVLYKEAHAPAQDVEGDASRDHVGHCNYQDQGSVKSRPNCRSFKVSC